MREVMEMVSKYAMALGVLELILCFCCLWLFHENFRLKYVRMRKQHKEEAEQKKLEKIIEKIAKEKAKLRRAEGKHVLPTLGEPIASAAAAGLAGAGLGGALVGKLKAPSGMPAVINPTRGVMTAVGKKKMKIIL